MVPQFSSFIGVDQTGAAVAGGRMAKPLPVAVVSRRGKRGWALRSKDPRSGRALQVAGLNPDGLGTLLSPETALMVDCVFGLPSPVARALGLAPGGAGAVWRIFRRAAATRELPLYGRVASEAFFARLAADAGTTLTPLPRRRCERACGANSVFLTRPFQKNVQTGTHRIWRDIGEAPGEWAAVWPFDDPEDPANARPWLFESYPSLLWRELFGLRTRDRTALAAAATSVLKSRRLDVQVDDWDFITADPERADAAVLALGGLALQVSGRLFAPYPRFQAERRTALALEGWITGLGEAPACTS